jgi:hypothetical protein
MADNSDNGVDDFHYGVVDGAIKVCSFQTTLFSSLATHGSPRDLHIFQSSNERDDASNLTGDEHPDE